LRGMRGGSATVCVEVAGGGPDDGVPTRSSVRLTCTQPQGSASPTRSQLPRRVKTRSRAPAETVRSTGAVPSGPERTLVANTMVTPEPDVARAAGRTGSGGVAAAPARGAAPSGSSRSCSPGRACSTSTRPAATGSAPPAGLGWSMPAQTGRGGGTPGPASAGGTTASSRRRAVVSGSASLLVGADDG
jgi:hypothetical protein